MARRIKDITAFNGIKIKLTDQVRAVNKKHAQQLALAIRKSARNVLPAKGTDYTTGTYANGWTIKQLDDGAWLVYNNGENKSLSHLLEHGHSTRQGGGMGFVPPQIHIRPAYNAQLRAYKREIENMDLEVEIN